MDALEIKLARKTLNMSQTEFGAMLGAKLRTVQSWESGERSRFYNFIEKLYTKISENYIIQKAHHL